MTDALFKDHDQAFRLYLKHGLCPRTIAIVKHGLFAYVHDLALNDETLSLVTMPLTAVVRYKQLHITTRSFEPRDHRGAPEEFMYYADTTRMTLPPLHRCRVSWRSDHSQPSDGTLHTNGIPQSVCDQLCVLYKDLRRQFAADAMNYLIVADIEVDDEFVTLDVHLGREAAWSAPPEFHTRSYWDCRPGEDDDISLISEKTTPRVTG